MNRDLTGCEGPRTPREDERDAVIRLVRSVFAPSQEETERMGRAWPMTRHDDRRENTFAIFRDGEPVSSIMRLERDCLVRGHRLRVGYVGAVCTHPAHRGAGLASALLEATYRRLRENSCDFAYISGTRPLYFASGADHTAPKTRYVIPRGTRLPDAPNVSARTATVDDAALLVDLSQSESTRFVRRPDDFRFVLETGHCAGQPCAFQIVEFGGAPVAYALLRRAETPLRVIEFAGDRLCLYAALSRFANDDADGALAVDAPRGDALGSFLAASGCAGSPCRDWGTVKVLDPLNTIRRLMPYFRERVAEWRDRGAGVAGDGDRLVAWCDGGSLEVDGERNVIRLLLGASEDAPLTNVRATGVFRDVVERCLPLPMPSFDLNMI